MRATQDLAAHEISTHPIDWIDAGGRGLDRTPFTAPPLTRACDDRTVLG